MLFRSLTIASTPGATLDLNGFNNSIGSLAGAGTVELGNGTLTTGGNNAASTFSGVINGTGGGITKIGSGTQTLSGDNTFGGNTTVSGGTLELNTPNFNTYRGSGIFINNGSRLLITQSGGNFRYDFADKTFTFGTTGGGIIETGPGTNTVLVNNNTFVTTGGPQNSIIGSGLNLTTTGGTTTFNVADGPDPVDLVEIGRAHV